MPKGSAVTDKDLYPVMIGWWQCRHGLQQVTGHPLAGLQQGFGTL
jgi:hypothetical protein